MKQHFIAEKEQPRNYSKRLSPVLKVMSITVIDCLYKYKQVHFYIYYSLSSLNFLKRDLYYVGVHFEGCRRKFCIQQEGIQVRIWAIPHTHRSHHKTEPYMICTTWQIKHKTKLRVNCEDTLHILQTQEDFRSDMKVWVLDR